MSEITERKVCSKCLENKLYSEFSRSKLYKSGWNNRCRECIADYSRNRRNNPKSVKPNIRTLRKQIAEDVVTEWIPHVKTVSWRSGRYKDVVHTTWIHQESLKETDVFFLDEADLEITISE